ncbi:MAG: PDZ domain-containing protein [Pirellulaceae bacterium]
MKSIAPPTLAVLMTVSLGISWTFADDTQPASVPSKSGEDDVATSKAAMPSPEAEAKFEKWVSQLGSTDYRTREWASQRLLHAGVPAVEALEVGLSQGSLETTSRIISILQKLSTQFDPRQSDTDVAGESLARIETSGASSAALRAELALEEVRNYRKKQAFEALTSADVFIGFGDYHLASVIKENTYHLRVSQDWRGSVDALSWLSWLHGVETVILSGNRIDAKVIGNVATMPDLKVVIIRDTTIKPDDLKPLESLNKLDIFQLVNVPAGDELLDTLTALPLRRGLTLFGTDISLDGKARLEKHFPNLDIQCRGGFLGVVCSPATAVCEVGSVQPGTAAAEAGIQQGDVIVKFGEFKVERFADLQDAIAEQPTAEKPIPVVVQRIVEKLVEVTPDKPNDGDLRPTEMRVVRKVEEITMQAKLKRQFP